MLDTDALLNAAAKKTKTKKKSDVPVLEVKGDIAKSLVKRSKIKNAMTLAAAQLSQVEEDILPHAIKFHTAEVKSKGAMISSIKLTSGETSISVDVGKNQYGKIDSDSEEDLKERFGDDYDNLFDKKMTVKLSKEALGDKDIIAKLVKAVGQENFSKYFEVDSAIVIKERFHNDRFMSDDNRIADAINEKIVRPNKVAMRG